MPQLWQDIDDLHEANQAAYTNIEAYVAEIDDLRRSRREGQTTIDRLSVQTASMVLELAEAKKTIANIKASLNGIPSAPKASMVAIPSSNKVTIKASHDGTIPASKGPSMSAFDKGSATGYADNCDFGCIENEAREENYVANGGGYNRYDADDWNASNEDGPKLKFPQLSQEDDDFDGFSGGEITPALSMKSADCNAQCDRTVAGSKAGNGSNPVYWTKSSKPREKATVSD